MTTHTHAQARERLLEKALRDLLAMAQCWETVTDGKHFRLDDSETVKRARDILSLPAEPRTTLPTRERIRDYVRSFLDDDFVRVEIMTDGLVTLFTSQDDGTQSDIEAGSHYAFAEESGAQTGGER